MNKPTALERIIERANKPDASEDAHQAALFGVLSRSGAAHDPRLAFVCAIPNGGDRDKASAGVMVATGTRAGTWDILIPFPSHSFPFGMIEMKREKYRITPRGGLSDEQVKFGKHLVSVGAWTAVCYSYTEALAAIGSYLNGADYGVMYSDSNWFKAIRK